MYHFSGFDSAVSNALRPHFGNKKSAPLISWAQQEIAGRFLHPYAFGVRLRLQLCEHCCSLSLQFTCAQLPRIASVAKRSRGMKKGRSFDRPLPSLYHVCQLHLVLHICSSLHCMGNVRIVNYNAYIQAKKDRRFESGLD